MISVKSYGGNRRSCNWEGAAGEANWGSSTWVARYTVFARYTRSLAEPREGSSEIASDKRRAHWRVTQGGGGRLSAPPRPACVFVQSGAAGVRAKVSGARKDGTQVAAQSWMAPSPGNEFREDPPTPPFSPQRRYFGHAQSPRDWEAKQQGSGYPVLGLASAPQTVPSAVDSHRREHAQTYLEPTRIWACLGVWRDLCVCVETRLDRTWGLGARHTKGPPAV